MISFKQVYLNEAISLKDAKKKQLSRKYSAAYKIDMLNKIFEDKDRLIYDIDLDDKDVINKELPLLQYVNSLLEKSYNSKIYSRADYIKGIAYNESDTERKQPQKVGKLLNKLSQKGDNEATKILKSFISDPIRSAKNTKDGYKVVISRHPYDVAGMSTDRNWTSCMNLGTKAIEYRDNNKGMNARYVQADIETGSIVAYIVNNSDRHKNGKLALRRPLARILMKPHINAQNSKDYAYSLGRIYGAPIKEFKDFIENWLKANVNNDTKGKSYYLPPNLYSDGDTAVNFKETTISKNFAQEILEDKLQHNDNYKYIQNFHIEATDTFYGGRTLELQITFEIPEKLKFHEFRYEYHEQKPEYITKILNAINLPTQDSRFITSNIHSFPIDSIIVAEYTVTDNFYDSYDNKYQDEDMEYQYWENMVEMLNLRKLDYKKASGEIVKIISNLDAEKLREKEMHILKKMVENIIFQNPLLKKIHLEMYNSDRVIDNVNNFLSYNKKSIEELYDAAINKKLETDMDAITSFISKYGSYRNTLLKSQPDKQFQIINPNDAWRKIIDEFTQYEEFNELIYKPLNTFDFTRKYEEMVNLRKKYGDGAVELIFDYFFENFLDRLDRLLGQINL